MAPERIAGNPCTGVGVQSSVTLPSYPIEERSQG